jgi:hypothetical protein
MCRDIERSEVNGVQIPGNKIEPHYPFLDTLIKTPYDHTSVDRLFKHISMHIIVAIHKS